MHLLLKRKSTPRFLFFINLFEETCYKYVDKYQTYLILLMSLLVRWKKYCSSFYHTNTDKYRSNTTDPSMAESVSICLFPMEISHDKSKKIIKIIQKKEAPYNVCFRSICKTLKILYFHKLHSYEKKLTVKKI